MVTSARRGMTLVELLVIIAILAIIIGLLIPSAGRNVRVASARAHCMNNLKQLILAIHCYEDMNPNDCSQVHSLPTGCIGKGSTPNEQLSWMVSILPFTEQDILYKQFDKEVGYDGNLGVAKTHIKIFTCPDGRTKEMLPDTTHYVAMAGMGHNAASEPAGTPGNGIMGYSRITTFKMIEDGTSNTIALMETRSALGSWARGGTSNLRGFDPHDAPVIGDHRAFGGHTNGMSAAMADGSVRFVNSHVNAAQLAAAITINGGEKRDADGSEW